MPDDLDKLKIYQLAQEVGEEIWELASGWSWEIRKTIGYQIIRSVDSIAANISEGLGRISYSERINFTYYARGSLYETLTWLTKASNRKLIGSPQFSNLKSRLDVLAMMINNYLKSLRKLRSRNHQKPSKS